MRNSRLTQQFENSMGFRQILKFPFPEINHILFRYFLSCVVKFLQFFDSIEKQFLKNLWYFANLSGEGLEVLQVDVSFVCKCFLQSYFSFFFLFFAYGFSLGEVELFDWFTLCYCGFLFGYWLCGGTFGCSFAHWSWRRLCSGLFGLLLWPLVCPADRRPWRCLALFIAGGCWGPIALAASAFQVAEVQ